MPVRLTNNARSLLAVSIGANETQVRVRVGHGARFPTLTDGEDWFPVAIEDDQGNVEITRCIARAGDVLTVRRAQDGTKARAFGAGALVSLRLTAPAMRVIFGLEDENPPPIEDPELDAPRGLIFNGLIVNAYHDEEGRQGYFHPYSGTSEGQYVFIGACYEAAKVIADYITEIGTPEALTLTGSLPAAHAYLPYEGRLQINNAIGYVRIEQTGGDELPPGHEIYVDQDAQEVVITWPAFEDIDVGPIYNGDFNSGIDGWILGEGWTIRPSAGEGQGFGDYVARHDGYVISRMESEAYVPCPPAGVTFPMQVNVQQGASQAGTAGAGVGISFYGPEPDYAHIETQLGQQIWSGAGGQWHLSRLRHARVPEGAAYMRAIVEGGHLMRFGNSNKPLWVDDVQWTVPTFVGEQMEDTYCIDLRVVDAEDREANWSGCIMAASLPRNLYVTGFSSPNTFFSSWLEGDEYWKPWEQQSISGSVSLWSAGGGILFRGGSIRSADGGQTWAEIPVAIPEGGTPTSAVPTPGVRTQAGTLIFVTASSNYSCLRSTDDGETIEAIPRTDSSTGGGNQVLMLDADGVPLRVNPLAILHSLDDGLTWSQRSAPPSGGSQFSPSTSNFVYGSDGETIAFAARASAGGDQIALSTDNGFTWVYKTIPGSGPVRYVTFNNGRWYAVADNGIYWADDPSADWTASTLPSGWTGSVNAMAGYLEGVLVSSASPVAESLMWSVDGRSFDFIEKPVPESRQISSIATATT